MKRNTATQLLRLLSEEELRKLSKFLRSPYFNYSPSVITLFECLRKWHPDYEKDRIRPHIHWKKIFPEKPFSEQSYWKLNFKFRCLIERFMAVEQMEGNEMEFKKQLIKSHAQRSAHSLFEQETKYLVEKINDQTCQDIHSYSSSLWLKHDYFFNPLTDKYGGALYSVEDAMAELDRFYLLAKLRLAAEIKNRERMFSKKVPIRLLEECLSASEGYSAENPAFLMYKNVLELYEPKKADTAFWEGKKIWIDNFQSLSKHDQSEVLLNLRNYAIRQAHKGITIFMKEAFELYKLGIEHDLVVIDGKINESTFSNIAIFACANKAFKWAEEFIQSYEKYLDEEIKEDAKIHSLGKLRFDQGAFDESIELFSQHNFSKQLHQMSAKITFMKAWFCKFQKDNSLYDLLISTLESVHKFYKRNSYISEQRKLLTINFILALKQLSIMVYKKEKADKIKKKMRGHLSGEKGMMAKMWLTEMVDHYTKK